MSYKQNLHTHSNLCDGKHTPYEIALQAVNMGFHSIGFSDHAYMEYCKEYSMSLENEKKYIEEVNRLKKVFKNKLEIFCGIEFDIFSGIDISSFDYTIGSVHFMLINGQHVGFDKDAKTVKNIINNYFNGNGLKYAEKYYETLSNLPNYGKFDIIGHFDLIAKHYESTDFFDINSKKYLSYAFEAIENLKGKIPLFEINTGGIARGYRTTPYPSVPILKELKNAGFYPIISSDSHDALALDCYFDQAEELLKSVGFEYKFVLTQTGFTADKL